MTYEWGYMYSTPQAISPIGPVRNVVQYAVSVIPRSKILLGQNLYGYDWTAPYPPQGGTPARAVSPQQAIAIALRKMLKLNMITKLKHLSSGIETMQEYYMKYGLRMLVAFKLNSI